MYLRPGVSIFFSFFPICGRILKDVTMKDNSHRLLWASSATAPYIHYLTHSSNNTCGCLHYYLEIRNLGCREVKWLAHFYKFCGEVRPGFTPTSTWLCNPQPQCHILLTFKFHSDLISWWPWTFLGFIQEVLSLFTVDSHNTPILLPRTFLGWGSRNIPSIFKHNSDKAVS